MNFADFSDFQVNVARTMWCAQSARNFHVCTFWDGFSSPSFFYSHRTPTWRPFEIRGSAAAAASILHRVLHRYRWRRRVYVKSVKSMHRSDFTCAWLYRYSVCQWDRHTKRAYFRLHCKPNTVQHHVSGTQLLAMWLYTYLHVQTFKLPWNDAEFYWLAAHISYTYGF